jgi:4-amino-4-deoxy-L-arabinose transferase-like glycosyltransferase
MKDKLFTFFKKNWILILILLLAALLRLWKLGSIPPSLTSDEASLGYNAYSILKTGRDEYGKLLPIIFKSFGDYKPGFYVYLTVPFVAVLGLTEFAVRFPSAIAGIISVFLVYLIAGQLFKNRKLSLISAFVMTIAPWAIYLSRGAWEVNVSLTLTLLGIYLFFKAFENQKLLILSALSFALTFITYQGAKLSTGLVLLILAILYWKEILRINRKYLIGGIITGILISLPIILSLFQGQTGRLSVFSIFSYERPKEYTQAILNQGKESVGNLNYYLFHSETLNYARGIMTRWFNHFSGRFLFFEGDWQNPRHTAPYQGVLLMSDLVILVLGLFALIKLGSKKEYLFIWFWLLLSSLPAILSRDQVHAVRSFNMVIPLVLILSLGWLKLLESPKKWILLFIPLFLGSTTYFLDAYFVHLPKHDSQKWQYGYKQIVETTIPIQDNYEKIKVQQSFAQPYIYFLFYGKYDPAKYQERAKLTENENKGDVGFVEKIDNIYFVPINWSADREEKGTLLVADLINISYEDAKDENRFKLIKEIKYLNGYVTAFRIIEVK